MVFCYLGTKVNKLAKNNSMLCNFSVLKQITNVVI